VSLVAPDEETKGTTMGVLEEGKGKAKEAIGDLTNDPDLRQEGTAQKKKGQAERQAAQERAKARAHDVEAREKELEQRAAESTK
jgi:uncharacterized protein YjbJ (UPF0337 family)